MSGLVFLFLFNWKQIFEDKKQVETLAECDKSKVVFFIYLTRKKIWKKTGRDTGRVRQVCGCRWGRDRQCQGCGCFSPNSIPGTKKQFSFQVQIKTGLCQRLCQRLVSAYYRSLLVFVNVRGLCQRWWSLSTLAAGRSRVCARTYIVTHIL